MRGVVAVGGDDEGNKKKCCGMFGARPPLLFARAVLVAPLCPFLDASQTSCVPQGLCKFQHDIRWNILGISCAQTPIK